MSSDGRNGADRRADVREGNGGGFNLNFTLSRRTVVVLRARVYIVTGRVLLYACIYAPHSVVKRCAHGATGGVALEGVCAASEGRGATPHKSPGIMTMGCDGG